MKLIILLIISICFSGCNWKQSESVRLKKREIVCGFSNVESCREIKCRAVIKTDLDKLQKSIKPLLGKMSYLNIKEGQTTWRFPWPFENISEKTTTEEKKDSILIKGEKKLKMISFGSSTFDETGSVLEIQAIVCSDIPSFIEENILFNGLKDVFKEIRDHLE